MRAARRISPALLRELMAVTGPPVAAYFASLDPSALGDPISWAGPEPAPAFEVPNRLAWTRALQVQGIGRRACLTANY